MLVSKVDRKDKSTLLIFLLFLHKLRELNSSLYRNYIASIFNSKLQQINAASICPFKYINSKNVSTNFFFLNFNALRF